MARNLVSAFAFLLLALACKKPKRDDLSGSLELKGTVYLVDSLRGRGEELLQKNLAIQIKNIEDSNTNNYLYQVVTNDLGAFTFTNLSDKPYVLYAETKADELLFIHKSIVSPAGIDTSIKVVLYPATEKSNIISLVSKDSVTQGVLTKTKVCAFRSRWLARNNQCEGAVYEKETNDQGKLVLSNLEPGWYYFNAQYTNGNVTLKARDSIFVGATGLYRDTLHMKLENWQGELKIEGTIYQNDFLSGFPEEVVLSEQTLQVKRLEDINRTNVLFTEKSNSQGRFTLPNLSERDYYLQSERIVQDVLFTYGAVVNPIRDKNLKVVLYPDTIKQNIISVITKDSATNGMITGARVCIFSSSLLARANNCEGAIRTNSTNNYGWYSTARLPEGWYYINTQYSVGNVDIKARDSIYLRSTGLVRKEIILK